MHGNKTIVSLTLTVLVMFSIPYIQYSNIIMSSTMNIVYALYQYHVCMLQALQRCTVQNIFMEPVYVHRHGQMSRSQTMQARTLRTAFLYAMCCALIRLPF